MQQNNKINDFFGRQPLSMTWIIALLVSAVMVFAYFGFFRPSLIGIGHRITTLHVEIAENSKQRVEGYFNENIESMQQLAQVLSVVEGEAEKKVIINNFIKDKNWFKELTLVNKKGMETLKISQFQVYSPRDYIDVSTYEYFIDAVNGDLYMSNVYTSDKAMPLITISVPILESADNTVGVLSAELSLQPIWEMVSSIKTSDNGRVYLVDALGYIIAHEDSSLVLGKKNVVNRRAVEKVITEKEIVYGLEADEEYINEEGERVYVVGLPLPNFGWGIFVESPYNEVWASYQKIRMTGLMLGFVTLVLLLVLMLNNRILNKLFFDLRKGRELLSNEVEKRTGELQELDKTTKLLVKRDLELSVINQELDKKIEQLERSEKSLLRAFGDIQATRRRMEEEKDKTEAVITNFIDPIIVIDEDHKISLFNPAAQRIFGMNNDDLGKEVSDKDNFSMENFEQILGTDFEVKALEDEENQNTKLEEVSLKHGEHELTYKVVTAKVINNRNQDLGYMKIFYDVTREKMIDKLKSEFISIAAHQLRTPLSAIKWVIKMVLDEDVGELNDEQKELLDKGYKSNERIIVLVNDLLNVSRIEEGRFGYTFERHNLMEILEPVVADVEGLLKKNDVKLTINKSDDLSNVLVDKDKITLVLQNVVSNAVKYTPEHGKIEINVEEQPKFIRFSVKDNGVGIPEADRAKLFKKFFRASNVIRMQTEGSGLGLFICKNIVEKHGGIISVSSKEGEGTEVSFTLQKAA